MPFISAPHFSLLQQHFGWTHEQTIKFLEECHLDVRQNREWLPQEIAVAKFLRTQPLPGETTKFISYKSIGKILNRPGQQVFNYLQGLMPSAKEKAKEYRIRHRQSEGAQWLQTMIQKKFAPNFRIVPEYAIRHNSSAGGHSYPALRIDYYLPQMHLAFEYDGPQHDQFVEFFHKDAYGFRRAQAKDRKKDELCAKRGIDLIRFSHRERLTENLFNRKLDAVLEKKIEP